MAKTLRLTCLAGLLALVPSLALAQLPVYRPANYNAAVGERYNVEAAFGYWNPTPDIVIASTALNTIGTQINAANDLGFAQKRLPDLHLVVRPAQKHKFRFEYIPISYSAEAILTRTITFRGVTYSLGLPVNSTLDWKQYRFGYEYDFFYRSRGFVGFIADVKYTDVSASVASPIASAETRQTAPIPALGGIARGYIARNVSLTGEITGFKLPESVSSDTRGRYVDFDVYGTVNVTNNVGVQAGYRSIDAMFQVTNDSGELKLKGVYFRGVVRF